MGFGLEARVETHSKGPASNGNTLITEAIFKSLEKFFFSFFIGNNQNPPITDKYGWPPEIH